MAFCGGLVVRSSGSVKALNQSTHNSLGHRRNVHSAVAGHGWKFILQWPATAEWTFRQWLRELWVDWFNDLTKPGDWTKRPPQNAVSSVAWTQAQVVNSNSTSRVKETHSRRIRTSCLGKLKLLQLSPGVTPRGTVQCGLTNKFEQVSSHGHLMSLADGYPCLMSRERGRCVPLYSEVQCIMDNGHMVNPPLHLWTDLPQLWWRVVMTVWVLPCVSDFLTCVGTLISDELFVTDSWCFPTYVFVSLSCKSSKPTRPLGTSSNIDLSKSDYIS